MNFPNFRQIIQSIWDLSLNSIRVVIAYESPEQILATVPTSAYLTTDIDKSVKTISGNDCIFTFSKDGFDKFTITILNYKLTEWTWVIEKVYLVMQSEDGQDMVTEDGQIMREE